MDDSVLDPYGDFIETKFYLNEFGLIPSLLNLEMPLPETADNMDKIIGEIKKLGEIEIIIEKWNISKNKDNLKSKDFINFYFLKIAQQSVCVQIELGNDMISINFWYHPKISASKNWTLTCYREIRNTIGNPATPTFKVLAKNSGNFYVEEVNIQNTITQIEANYNEDFKAINTIINNALNLDKSGLILLHGKPGTGKTSYIKNLLTTHNDKNFIFIPNDFINELLQPNFISFLIAHRNSILIIEDAEKVISSREQADRNSVVSTILQLTDGLFSDCLNIKVICTFNTNINNIDKALLRKGRMIAFYEFKALSLEKTNQLLTSLNHKKSDKGLSLAEIYYAANTNFDKEQHSIGFKNTS